MPRESLKSNPDPRQDRDSLLEETICSITRLASRRYGVTLFCVCLSALLCAGYALKFMRFNTERADLIDPAAEFHQRWIEYTESFGEASDLIVVVEGDSADEIRRALDDLGERVGREPDLFSNVLYKVETAPLRKKGLQYLSPDQLQAGLDQLKLLRPVLQGNWDLIRLDSLFQRFRYQLEDRKGSGTEEDLAPLLDRAELLTASMHRFLQSPEDYSSPWPPVVAEPASIGGETAETVYQLNDERTMGFLKAVPAERGDDFNGATRAIDRMRQILEDLSVFHSELQFGLTGIPVLENDEMRRSQSDMIKASGLSCLGVGLLMLLGFRGFRHPLLAMVMLAVGMAWSFGYTTLIVGHLNILSVSFAVILIGLGIDFAIHYLARYLELRHIGFSLPGALEKTSAGVGTGIVTAAVTTAMAFFCATFTEFLGVAELGIIAGGGILLCAAATFLVLPALITQGDRDIEPRRLPTPFQAKGLRAMTARYPRSVTALSLVVVAAIGAFALQIEDGRLESRVRYDSNLLNLQAEGLNSVELQKRVFHGSEESLLFAVSTADSPQQALALKQKFEALPSVGRVVEQASGLPEHSSAQTGLLVQAYGAELAKLPDSPPEPAAGDPSTVGLAMEGVYKSARNLTGERGGELVTAVDRFLADFEKRDLNQQVAFLQAYQNHCAADLLEQLRRLRAASAPEPVTVEDLPGPLASRFVSGDGKWLLQVFPQEQIWDLEPLSRFVADVRSVDPEATGTPLQNFEASRQIKRSYRAAAVYALAVICLVLLVDFLSPRHKLLSLLPPLVIVGFAALTLDIRREAFDPVLLVSVYVGLVIAVAAVLDFRNLRDALLALVPAVGGGLLTFGLLGCFGIDLNPANLIVLPLVLGIGVDDGVHVVHDFRLQTGRYRPSASTINAILLTSLTSMIGFGSMMVAAHRGLYSVGLVLVIGIGSCLFVSLVPLPAVLTLISARSTPPRMRKTLTPPAHVPSAARETGAETAAEIEAAESLTGEVVSR